MLRGMWQNWHGSDIYDAGIYNVFNSSPPGQNGHHFIANNCICNLKNEKLYILIKVSLKFVPKGWIDNKPALV